MKTLTAKDVAINAAQVALDDARSRLHTYAQSGDLESAEYLAASDDYETAITDLATAHAMAEEFKCVICGDLFDGLGRVVVSVIHTTIHSDADGSVEKEYEFSTGNQRHLVFCPDCNAELRVETDDVPAIATYFNYLWE